jgi:hypothetical protein
MDLTTTPMTPVLPNPLAGPLVAEDYCPMCLGELDTGWECNDCGYDAIEIARRQMGKVD